MATGPANVLLDKLAKRLAVVLDRSIQGTKVMNGAKENAANKDPEKHGEPAKHHGDNGARDRACATNRGELVGKHGEALRRREVLAVLHADRRGEDLGIDAP
jgi:hypothetical protein